MVHKQRVASAESSSTTGFAQLSATIKPQVKQYKTDLYHAQKYCDSMLANYRIGQTYPMRIVYILAGLVATTAAAAITSTTTTTTTLSASELVRGGPPTAQDISIPYCRCTARRLLCCSDAGCEALEQCSA
ncbi:hypothetical protein F5X97DRAFT_321394 [Nemania serpens]|nr:hypothetical protein F5X97DRAFT_321394 [Nemania serpens]